jgi:DNA-binding PadR family transcriptional regulator
MAPHSFQILLSLLDGDKHGYSIIKDIEERSGGKILLGTSTVYAAIKRMVMHGILRESDSPPDTVSGGPKRRYYGITPFGRQVARAEGVRIAELNDMVAGSALLAQEGGKAQGEASS